ncbi:hypothetical protein RHGRI_034114 [Rhododendron griersonianum]|uniref:Uncharacterized protein n=1 Tax=Rhododendron griersonianum TaxID=479676 RepID=A0AAV6I4X9_9ERIC|nr:hypothetical protein RHGRI_034114 [Rhododendron griersonianum]
MDNFVDVERPVGRKGEKERSFQEQPMKQKNKDITSSAQFAGALDEIKECKTNALFGFVFEKINFESSRGNKWREK